VLAPVLAALQAPSGSPPDVSPQLLGICDVMDACEGLSSEAVIEAAERKLKPSGSPGEHRLPDLGFGTETVSADVGHVDASCQALGSELETGWVSRSDEGCGQLPSDVGYLGLPALLQDLCLQASASLVQISAWQLMQALRHCFVLNTHGAKPKSSSAPCTSTHIMFSPLSNLYRWSPMPPLPLLPVFYRCCSGGGRPKSLTAEALLAAAAALKARGKHCFSLLCLKATAL